MASGHCLDYELNLTFRIVDPFCFRELSENENGQLRELGKLGAGFRAQECGMAWNVVSGLA